MPTPARDENQTSAARYARRNRGRTADEDGSFAAGFASVELLNDRNARVARALAEKDLIEAQPVPPRAIRGAAQLFLIFCRYVPELASVFSDEYVYVRRTLERLRDTNWLRDQVSDPKKLRQSQTSTISKVYSLLDVDGKRSATQLQSARDCLEGRPVPRDPAHSDVLHTMRLGCAVDVYGACRRFGERLIAARGAGAPESDEHISFYFGACLHFLANRFGEPGPADLADLSMHWEFDIGDRASIVTRWRKRIQRPWAAKMRALAHELLETGAAPVSSGQALGQVADRG